MREIYVGSNFRFKYCNWDMYGERITLTSSLKPYKNILTGPKGDDIVANLAVFTVLPLEFYAVLQIKRSVFGKTCNHVNVSEELLILGIGTADVHIYSFPEVIREGCVTSFKLGDAYEKGKVGYYPTGLPLNCHINSAPPLLFNVRCFGQEIRFGGFPFCYITCSIKDEFKFLVQTIDGDKTLKNGFLRCTIVNDDPNPVCFHPDNSNRIIFQNSQTVRCYKIINSGTSLELQEDFTMHCSELPTVTKRISSSYGRPVLQKFHFSNEKTVVAVDYEDELDIFAILFMYPNDPACNGYIKLYDNFIKQGLRTFNIDVKLEEINSYELHMDLNVIVVLEKVGATFKVHVYRLG
ncbi:DDB1- and CUL4-associated factor 17, partial [Stegodyphus mimosarum]